jgi:hypothetical protein
MSSEPLNDVQFKILDSVYFVESYEHIREEVDEPEPVLIDELRNMIDKGYIQVMEFKAEIGDFERTAIFDSGNLSEYAFLATRDGLLKHNGH